jgi:uncharacterized protein (DUF952 family)
MIFHIVKRTEWELAFARGSYAPDSLRTEGFIHCSTISQVIDTANRFYRGQTGLVVLCIDEARVLAELKYEAPAGNYGESVRDGFPHIYGELNVDAVLRLVELPCEADRTFRLPDELRTEKES